MELSSEQVYAKVSPSVVLVETTAAIGSGVLIDGGYVVTNYHVVWPYDGVWIVLPDGTKLEGVPVVGWDPMADIAVLGPIDASADALTMADGESAAPGSELFLVGYPAEVEEAPQPTITRGILSRIREWERLGMTYFQTDAAIAGGQSGGALVNTMGEVIGISTFSFAEDNFALASSSADVMPIVNELIENGATDTLGPRRLPTGRGEFEHDIQLDNYWDSEVFVLDATAGTAITVTVDGAGDSYFNLSDTYEPILEVDAVSTGEESGTVEVEVPGPHFLQVELASGDASSFDVSSNVRMSPLRDPDDGKVIEVGDTIAGNLDHYLDADWYSLTLSQGETVRVTADSLNVDTFLVVDFPGSRVNQIVSDDDSGGGLSGVNSELVYRAPHDGEYFIAVHEAESLAFGGYYLTIEAAEAGSETVTVPSVEPLVASPFGNMIVYEDPFDLFSIQIPEAWIEGVHDETLGQVFFAYDSDQTSNVTLTLEDVLSWGLGELTLDEYADVIETYVYEPAGITISATETITTAQGLDAIVLRGSLAGFAAAEMLYILEDNVGVSVYYTFPIAEQQAGNDLANYSFDTFTVN